MSWLDAIRFCNRLSHREQLHPAYQWQEDSITLLNTEGYRLPIEAEREFATRSGSELDHYFDSDDTIGKHAWCDDNSGGRTHAVGLLRSNAFDLYDVHGNVFEWCWDVFDGYPEAVLTNPQGAEEGPYRVHRSGSWENPPQVNRSAMRSSNSPSLKNHRLGFRVAISVDAVRGM